MTTVHAYGRAATAVLVKGQPPSWKHLDGYNDLINRTQAIARQSWAGTSAGVIELGALVKG